MPDNESNSWECTTPEAWTELVRTERLSARQKQEELAFAHATIAHLSGLLESLMRPADTQESA